MKQPLFTGVCTALVTPFRNGKINEPMLRVLLKRQLDFGVKHVVLSGTTGESATLSDDEKIDLIRIAKDCVKDQMMIIAGTGSNDTAHAITTSKAAEEAGADAVLVVSPYYNKATNDGLIAHYLSIAQAIKIPIIIYNVPSRTGVDIPVSVYKTLSKTENIAGVKEAAADINKILKIRAECPDSFSVWSGNDDMTVPIVSLGGKGVISVTSNVIPNEFSVMTNAALNGDFDTAGHLQTALYPLTQALFAQVNPIPVKYAMAAIGYDCGPCRLPLTNLLPEYAETLNRLLQ